MVEILQLPPDIHLRLCPSTTAFYDCAPIVAGVDRICEYHNLFQLVVGKL